MPDDPPSSYELPQVIAAPGDVGSIDAIVQAVYESVSFDAGAGPDGPRLASLCGPHARLSRVNRDGITDMSVGEFIAQARQRVATSGLQAFHEVELFRRTEVFAGIAHVFTTYESTATMADASETSYRGINSIQLRHDGSRWWILTVLWTEEHEDTPIPAAYLPRGTGRNGAAASGFYVRQSA